MANWTDIPSSDVDPESPITTGLMTALRDNVTALAEGASGAPSVVPAALSFAPIEVLFEDDTPVGNVGAGEDDLMSYTMPAGKMANDGDRLRITAYFLCNGIDNTTAIVYLGSTSHTLWTATNFSSIVSVQVDIIRLGANSQWIFASYIDAGGTVATARSVAAEDLTSELGVKFTGSNTSDASDDAIQQLFMNVEYIPAP